MAARDVVVIGASAGGVEALRALVAALPPDLPAAVAVVLHIPARSPSALPAILRRSGPLPAVHATDGDTLRNGIIYVAPADHHLLIRDGRLSLSHGPAENGHRPAIDPLFRSAARAFGERVAGVVLSGARDDGTSGLAAIKSRGGLALVQDPAEALHPSMPRSALDHLDIDHVHTSAGLGALIGKLAMDGHAGLASPPQASADLDEEVEMSEMTAGDPSYLEHPAGFGCPSCHGSLFDVSGSPVPRYRCRVGHAWSPESLLDEQAAALEGALWMALRSLEEKSALSQRMSESARGRGNERAAERYRETAVESLFAAGRIRELIQRLDPQPAVVDDAGGADVSA
jgi:two-component system chemotaxis response regulator CheB